MNELYELYRPTKFEDMVGSSAEVAVETVRRLQKRGLGGRKFWIIGPSGCGKSTLAWLIALEVADRWIIQEVDASGLTLADVDQLERAWNLCGPGKGGRAYIINEAHALTPSVVKRLLTAWERVPQHVVIIMTSQVLPTHDDTPALLSRCTNLKLTADLEEFAASAQEIARIEGLDGKPIEHYYKLARDEHGNFRAMLQAIEAGKMLAGGVA